MKTLKFFEDFIFENVDREAIDLYEKSLKDDYWRLVSKQFPNYNSPDTEDNAKAVEFILKSMKEMYKDANWKTIEKTVREKIQSGLT